jgi:hypothetical protein
VAVHFERIPSTDPRLGRHVRHDDRSRAYAYPTDGLTLTSAKHTRRIPVLDQGDLGSCTGNAGIGALGTDPFYDGVQQHFVTDGPGRVPYGFDEFGAVALYAAATWLDDAPGHYPPDDTGSDGLSVAKALKAAGEISGYQHTFTLTDALLALGQTPVITGVSWYDRMFDPDPDGRLHIGGAVAGGHEFVVDEIDAEQERVWLTNSWGTSWGVGGRAYLTFDDWGRLLDEQGDVTVFTPLTSPAPTPTPADPDRALAAAARPWVIEHHVGGNRAMANALKAWLAAKHL